MIESSIPSLSYADFGKKLTAKIGEERYPLTGMFEVTPYCNLKCVHCYVTHCRYQEKLLSLAEIRDIFDKVVARGCLWMQLTGGEPLLRPDFLDIYSYAKKKGLVVTILTNGTLITPAIADYLYEWKPRAVEISLYGATRETYEKVTGVAGSYEKCIRGIELLAERRIPLRLKTMALTINRHEIGQMKQYADSLGLNFRFDASIGPRLDGGLEPCDYRLTPEEVVELDIQFPEHVQQWNERCQGYSGLIVRDSLYLCGAGRYSYFIDPFGRLTPCLMARSQSYDLRRSTFDEGWDRFLADIREQKAMSGSKCSGCGLQLMCDRCPPLSELETGDQNKEVAWMCRLTHLRLSAFGMHKPEI